MVVIKGKEKSENTGKSVYHADENEVHEAVVTGVYDLGIQKGFIEGEDKRQVLVVLDLEEMTEGAEEHPPQHKTATAFVNATLNQGGGGYSPSKLYTIAATVLKKDFTQQEIVNGVDLQSLVGKPCKVTIKNTGKGANKLLTILQSKKEPFKADFPESTPEWVQNIIDKRLDKPEADLPF